MSDAHQVIQRCTRNGVIQWGQVAKQLGVSVDRARRLYDEASSARRDPQQLAEPDPESLPDAEAYKSPHPTGDSLKAVILTLLERHAHMTVQDLAIRTHSTPGSIRRRLSDLTGAFLVCSDEHYHRTWSLTQAGRAVAKAHHTRPGDIGPGALSDVGQAA